MPVFHLFVYGTLRKGFKNKWQALLEKKAKSVGIACIQGYLYDLGSYPGAVYNPTGDLITGELYHLQSDQMDLILESLDKYEGDEYIRIRVEVTLTGGKKEIAHLYNYIGSTSNKRKIYPADYSSYVRKLHTSCSAIRR